MVAVRPSAPSLPSGRFRHGLEFLFVGWLRVRHTFHTYSPSARELRSLPSFPDRKAEIVGLPDPAFAPSVVGKGRVAGQLFSIPERASGETSYKPTSGPELPYRCWLAE
jgi:hypothetical protein